MKNSHVIPFAHHYFQDIKSVVAEESDVDFNPVCDRPMSQFCDFLKWFIWTTAHATHQVTYGVEHSAVSWNNTAVSRGLWVMFFCQWYSYRTFPPEHRVLCSICHICYATCSCCMYAKHAKKSFMFCYKSQCYYMTNISLLFEKKLNVIASSMQLLYPFANWKKVSVKCCLETFLSAQFEKPANHPYE